MVLQFCYQVGQIKISAFPQMSCEQLAVSKDGFEFPEPSSGLPNTPQLRVLLPEEEDCGGQSA